MQNTVPPSPPSGYFTTILPGQVRTIYLVVSPNMKEAYQNICTVPYNKPTVSAPHPKASPAQFTMAPLSPTPSSRIATRLPRQRRGEARHQPDKSKID